MFRTNALVAALFILGGAALACGPFFPWQLLDDRKATLHATPHNSFVFEATHLVPRPPERLTPNEYQYEDASKLAADFQAAEVKGLTEQQASVVAPLRHADSGDAAYAQGAILPEAVRLYTAGAVAFRLTDLPAADRYFEGVLKLAPQEQTLRATWAAYMAGRTAMLANDGAKAARLFALARKLASDGQPDPEGLGVASYGEEGKFHYDNADALLQQDPAKAKPAASDGSIPDNPKFEGYSLPRNDAGAFGREMAAATELYAKQASYGSDSGVQSLRIIAENILEESARIDAVASSPLMTRLMVDYVLARLGDDPGHEPDGTDAGMLTDPTPSPVLAPLVAAILKAQGAHPADADRLAALCYRIGRYDLAEKLARAGDTPLAEWVQAKIALQKGDMAGAAQHYAAASRGFAKDNLDASNTALVVGESGTLALARGEYVDALDKLYPFASTYWGDVAYIGERVLTVDELKTFVDTHAAPRKAKDGDAGFGLTANPGEQMRNLLARRLMRNGRYAAAFPYFTDPKIRDKAKAYAMAVHEADTDWLPVDRAQAFFAAAKLARESGMDILGYEGAPDFSALSGEYDTGVGQSMPAGAYVTADEGARMAASMTKPRFHYRYIALDDATKAADLLPARSEAFAASLCWADHWMMQTPGEDARVNAIYERYVAQGPRVAWATHFGHNCPEPNFAGAGALGRRVAYRHARHYASQHRWWFAGGTGALVAFSGLFFAIGRRRRVTPPS